MITSQNAQNHFSQMNTVLLSAAPTSWEQVASILYQLKDSVRPAPLSEGDDFIQKASKGTAFVTFDYGIDGVSIEIAKYAQALENLYESAAQANIHLIGGDFHSQADSVLKPEWQRFRIEGINGWSKWDGGKWFAALFYEDMPDGSDASRALASEIYQQAVLIAQRIGAYLVEHDISLLIPVNIASNPGNLALTLGFTFVTEGMGIRVINSNHDFYWDGGKPSYERQPGEPPGVRDHFFRNNANRPFFSLFESLYPWNGKGWLQTNINRLQSDTLVDKFGFSREQVYELGTSISDEFFREYTHDDVIYSRRRMGYILSDGEPLVLSTSAVEFTENLGEWIENQRPCVLGARSGLVLDTTSEELIYLLQLTRVVARKRIERDLELIGALLERGTFRGEFERRENLQLVLHITGPTPIEHQVDLDKVLQAYLDLIDSVPRGIGDRLFLAFSVGSEDHPSFRANNFEKLHIEDIYRMATAVVFPSEVEGRGLPIVESSAGGIPIICSRYYPQEVFAEVVGEGLPDIQRIHYTLFPEGEFSKSFLDEVSRLLLQPGSNRARASHNRAAVRSRYSSAMLSETFAGFLELLNGISFAR